MSSFTLSLHKESNENLTTDLCQISSVAVNVLTKQTVLLLLITRGIRERNTMIFHCDTVPCTCVCIFSADVCPSGKKISKVLAHHHSPFLTSLSRTPQEHEVCFYASFGQHVHKLICDGLKIISAIMAVITVKINMM